MLWRDVITIPPLLSAVRAKQQKEQEKEQKKREEFKKKVSVPTRMIFQKSSKQNSLAGTSFSQ